MSETLPAHVRQAVRERARWACEYCLFPEAAALHPHEPDHIIPVQHGGETILQNLALACFPCNRRKGANVGSYDPLSGQLTPFFHPRRQRWGDHFVWREGVIEPLTPEGRVTAKIFQLNTAERVAERLLAWRLGLIVQPD